MKFFVVFFIAIMPFGINAFSQCTPDFTFVPNFTNYGLSPDTLPDGEIYQDYNQDLTFFLPLDTLVDLGGVLGETTIVFEDYHITSISLPLGLDWQCNNQETDCHYIPTDSQYGCVSIQGQPMEQGYFDVDVTVIATHELSDLVGTETIAFSLPLYIAPSSSQNIGFSMNNFSGCAPLIVDFINNQPGLQSYNWDFGNGMTSNLENPISHTFNDPGVYIINYESNAETYYMLESVEIVNASGWGNESIFEEERFTSPDAYFLIYDQNGNLIFESSHFEDQDFPVSWNMDNFDLSNQTYTIVAMEEDGVSTGDDNLGSINFNGFSSSANYTSGDLSINLVINQIVPEPIIAFDTVYVFETPQNPIIEYDDQIQVLSFIGDSLDMSYHWFLNGEELINENNINMYPIHSGDYSLMVNQNGCLAYSDELFALVCMEDFLVEINQSGNQLSCSNEMSFAVQWYLDGEPIFGANSNEFIAVDPGAYSIELTDEFGCVYKSDELSYSTADLYNYQNFSLNVFPNPSKSLVNLTIDNPDRSEVYFILSDLQGRDVIQSVFDAESFQFDVSNLNSGIYMITVRVKKSSQSLRLLVD